MSLVHLHCHSEFSALDGLSTPAEAASRAASAGQGALAITDHGMCSGHPAHQRACDAEGIKPVFGIETYFVPDRLERPETGDKTAQQRLRENRHLVLLATDDQGLRDLWALSSEAHATGHYHRPRCDWELLERYGSHLIATTSCLGGVISQQLLEGDMGAALRRTMRFKRIFGDRFYLEIQGNALAEQRRLNLMLGEIAVSAGIPLVAASDAHYPSPAEKQLHRLWMSCQTSPANDAFWNYTHMQTGDEMEAALGYMDPKLIDEAIRNTTLIAEQCNARVGGHAEPPVFGASHEQDAARLLDLSLAAWGKIRRPGQDYRDRLEREWVMVADKDLAGCYLIVHDVVTWARARGILVGPGRGSAAGSLMSYLLGITSMDPLETGLLFERFLTRGRTALPDFDMDFPSSARTMIQDYVIRKYGAERVVRVGTHMRYRAKGILNKLFSVMRPDSEDGPRISSIIDQAEAHTAGLGLEWPELMDEVGDELEPYAQRWPSVFEAAGQLAGRLNSYGKHPAGLVISTSQELAQFLPMRTDDKGARISQWDFRDLEANGVLKLDFLTLRTLDSIQEAINLVRDRTGVVLDPPAWYAEHRDPQAWEDIATGHTRGMFQIETSLGQAMCRSLRPATLSELADVVALVRPGPSNSGMTAAYLRRRAGREDITAPHPKLETHLSRSLGLMVYQEDILVAVRVLAGYDEAEADKVRSLLGKKKVELIEAAGQEFVRCAVARGEDREAAESLWGKMAEFGRYGFNRAHAYSYATLSYWTAWLKAHYPVETITAILSTLDDKSRMAAFATEARRIGITILPPDVRVSGSGFTAEGIAIRYGLGSVKGLGRVAIGGIISAQPYATLDDFLQRSQADAGVVWALAQAGALDPFVPTRRSLVERLRADRTGDATRCVYKDTEQPLPLQCSYNWDAELQPVALMGKRKLLKVTVKPPPKRCTRACRQYTPPSLSFGLLPEYPHAELWRLEDDIYGTWMTPAAFEELDRLRPGMRSDSREMARLLPAAPFGAYPLPAVVAGMRSAITRKGSVMWWLRLATEVSQVDVAVFSPRREDEPDLPSAVRFTRRGSLVLATIIKDAYRTPSGQVRISWRLEDIAMLSGG
jgi:DNA polymerase III subunit alpha